MTKPKWGFIGASNIAKSYVIPAIKKCGGIAENLYSSDPIRGQQYASEHDISNVSHSLEELLADKTLDAIYISTTNELHKAQCLAAAKAHKHVLCEKPLALSLMDAIKMQATCQQEGVVLGTNHHLRNAATHQTLRNYVQSGAIGEILSARIFHAIYLPENLQGWRINKQSAGGGVILDITVHDVDTMRFILNDEVESVIATSTAQGMAQHGLADSVMGVMHFKSGTLVQFHDSFTTAHAPTGIEIHGTTGSLFAKDVMTQEPKGSIVLKRLDYEQIIEVQHHNLYEHAISHFHNAMHGQGHPYATAEDGIKSLAVALTILDACKENIELEVKYTGD